ncbi:MAG: RNA polymerase Rpb4 family protein [Euryarchaeota archaeon]|nr:RNA polymerase Rpb4 family protein [Euryarchaeota archaeon]
MMGKKKYDEKKLTLPEVKEILGKRKEDSELLYEQGIALDHLIKFSKLDTEDAQKLKEELIENKVPSGVAVKITNILPEDKNDLKVIFAKERHMLDDKIAEKILETIKKYK